MKGNLRMLGGSSQDARRHVGAEEREAATACAGRRLPFYAEPHLLQGPLGARRHCSPPAKR
jgi:hypothetical protein